MLLRDWDIERFFSTERSAKQLPPSNKLNVSSSISDDSMNKVLNDVPMQIEKKILPKNNTNQSASIIQNKSNNLSNATSSKNTFLTNLIDISKKIMHENSDSKISLNLAHGFRRENSDFFPLSKRHSAILGAHQINAAPIVPNRSSAIYAKNNKNNKGEPILTDFVSRDFSDNLSTSSSSIVDARKKSNITTDNNRNSFFIGPRREKTESVILLQSSANKNLLFERQQVTTIIVSNN